MGYLRHKTLVVNGWDAARVLKAHAAATVIFNRDGYGALVSGLVQHAVNAGGAFFIAPDGSKEGWEDSDKVDTALASYIGWLKSDKATDLFLNWALIEIGGDDRQYGVIQHAEYGDD